MRIVICEDNALLRAGLNRLVGDEGHEVVASLPDAIELRDKVGRVSGPASVTTTAAPASGAGWQDQVTEALTGLGYSAKQAGDAVTRVASAHPQEDNVSTLLRLALRGLRP